MSPQYWIALVVIAAVATLAATPLIRALSIRCGVVDRPGERKVHRAAVSRLGGVAIFIGMAAALGAGALGERFLGWGEGLGGTDRHLWAVLAGMTVIFTVGLLDDIFSLKPGQKFLGQLLAAGVVIAWGPRVDFIGNPLGGGLVYLGILSVPVTFLWIVGFTNIINLIDGLDGLAAGISAIAGTTFLFIAVESNQLAAVVMAAALVGACVGFLKFNFSPASIFMGDSGALLLGFTLASIALLGIMKSVAAITLAVPLLIVGVPIFDTFTAIVRRTRHGRPIQEADAGHIHHRLLGRGFDQRQTVLIIYTWSIALAVGGYSMRWVPSIVKLGVFIVLAMLSGFMAYWLGLFEAAHHHDDEM